MREKDITRLRRVKAARFLAKNFPNKYYLSYSGFNEIYVWQRAGGGRIDLILDIIC